MKHTQTRKKRTCFGFCPLNRKKGETGTMCPPVKKMRIFRTIHMGKQHTSCVNTKEEEANAQL